MITFDLGYRVRKPANIKGTNSTTGSGFGTVGNSGSAPQPQTPPTPSGGCCGGGGCASGKC